MTKETYVHNKNLRAVRAHLARQRYGKYGKRDLLIWQKIPTSMTKETYVHKKKK